MEEEAKKFRTDLLIAFVIAAALVGVGLALWKTDFLGMGGLSLPASSPDATDPALLVGEPAGAINTGLEQPRGIAFAGGKLYVAGDRRIAAFSLDDKPLETLDTAGEAPGCVTAADGAIWFASNTRVGVIRPGQATRLWPALEEGAHITSLAVAGEDVFVADAGHRVVLHFNDRGTRINRIGEKDEARHIPGLILPSLHLDVAAGKDRQLWVSNPGRHRLEKYTFNGELAATWGEYGPAIDKFCGCCNPTDFALLPDGSFVTAEKGQPRVKLYSPEGAFVGVVAGSESFSKNLFSEQAPGMDLAVTEDGRILVLDPSLKQVRLFRITKKK